MERILKEKTSADHLLYVSMKYTKTCDVILNLISRWEIMIDVTFDRLIEELVKKKKLPHIPESPVQKIEYIRNSFKKNPAIQKALETYIFFRRVSKLTKTREGEFRKNVNLKVIEQNGTVTDINLEKLKEYAEIMDKFISEAKLFISK